MKCRIEALELDAGVGRGEAPVDLLAGGVPLLDPRRHLPLDRHPVAQPAVQALALEDAQLDLSVPTLLHLL